VLLSEPVFPGIRVPTPVHHGNDDDLFIPCAVVDIEGKALDASPADTLVDLRGCERKETDPLKLVLGFIEKFLAQPGSLLFIIPFRVP
jgi:hypothetical protein